MILGSTLTFKKFECSRNRGVFDKELTGLKNVQAINDIRAIRIRASEGRLYQQNELRA